SICTDGDVVSSHAIRDRRQVLPIARDGIVRGVAENGSPPIDNPGDAGWTHGDAYTTAVRCLNPSRTIPLADCKVSIGDIGGANDPGRSVCANRDVFGAIGKLFPVRIEGRSVRHASAVTAYTRVGTGARIRPAQTPTCVDAKLNIELIRA